MSNDRDYFRWHIHCPHERNRVSKTGRSQTGVWEREQGRSGVAERRHTARSTPALDLAGDALTLALAQGISAYDGCYLALAQRLGAPLITADQKLEQKLAPAGLPVTWLGVWNPPPPTP